MHRRALLQLFGSLPVVGPSFAAKIQTEVASADLMKLSATGLQHNNSDPPSSDDPLSQEQRLAFKLPWVREELRALMLEKNRKVYQLDPDLACKRSFSLNAKICFQRQRNVERDLQAYSNPPYWHRVNVLMERVRSLLGLKTASSTGY